MMKGSNPEPPSMPSRRKHVEFRKFYLSVSSNAARGGGALGRPERALGWRGPVRVAFRLDVSL